MIHLIVLFLWQVKAQASGSEDCSKVGDIWSLHFGKDLIQDEQSCCFGIPGIICEGGQVTEIDWTRQKLQGSIPASIGDLIHLRKLYLSANRLSGEIPSEIKNLKELALLDLGYNRITGFGDALGFLTALKGVSLWYNKVSGQIPESIGTLSQLKGL